MIKKLKIFCLVLILALLDAGYAAVPFKTTCLFTDRLCYVSGDAVFLSIKQLEADSSLGISESVIYVDLVDAGNRFICGEIFKLSQHCASGYLQIPDSVKTSDYFLRAYTYQSKIYSSQPILDLKKIYITNRFVQNEVANSIQGNNSQVVFSGTPKVDAKACFLNLTDTVFEKRTKVTASLQLTDNNKGDIIYGAFSVKAVTPCELAMNEWNETNNINANQTVDAGQLGYQETEKKGIIVSGKVTHSITGNALSKQLVFLACNDSLLHLKYSLTDSTGNFKFLLPEVYGKQTLYFSVYNYPVLTAYTQAVISLDSKFMDGNEIASPIDAPQVNNNFNDSLNVLKSVIATAYGIRYDTAKLMANNNSLSFEQMFLAGHFASTVNMDDYVDLPDFIQITREILPFVRLRKIDGKYVFSVIDGTNNVIYENPTVFVDGVPLNDISAILGWGTDKIKSVQVQTEPRYFGDVTFDKGMIFIWTRKLDFWKNRVIKNTHIFTIQSFQKAIVFNFPDYSEKSTKSIPDFRQILFWEPTVQLNSENTVQFNFYTSDEPGEFELVFKGFSKTGKQVVSQKIIHVK